MKKLWLAAADRFDALQPRERLVIFLAVVALLVAAFVLLVLDPALSRYRVANTQLQQGEQTLQALDAQEVALIQASHADPDAATREAIAALQAGNLRLREQLDTAQARFVPPAQMGALLRDLVATQPGLELLALRTGKRDNLMPPGPDGEPRAGLYRHEVELELRGSYAALTAYLQGIEQLPWQLGFGAASLRVDTYPQARLRLVLHTISLEQAWLGF